MNLTWEGMYHEEKAVPSDITYSSDELIQYAHTLISSCGEPFVDTDSATGDEVVERPTNEEDNKARKRRKAKEPKKTAHDRQVTTSVTDNSLVEEDTRDSDFEWC